MSLAYKQIQKDLNSNGILDQTTFQGKFSVLENKGDGDCLFFSVCQQDDTYEDAKKLRKEVCDFYKDFTFEDSLYEENTLQKKLCFAYITDNTEYNARTGKPNKVTHVNRICKPKQYAGIMDIIAISIILQRPTILFNDIGEDVQQYIVEEYSDFTVSGNRPLYIRYDGAEHFEAVIPLLHNNTRSSQQDNKNQPKNIRSPPTKKKSPPTKKNPSPTKKKSPPTKKNPPPTKKQPSPPHSSRKKDWFVPPIIKEPHDPEIGDFLIKRFNVQTKDSFQHFGTIESYSNPYYIVKWNDSKDLDQEYYDRHLYHEVITMMPRNEANPH